jgi:hypothetical protein
MQMSAATKGRFHLGMFFGVLMVCVLSGPFLKACYAEEGAPPARATKLLMIWTSGEKGVALPGPALLYPMYTKQQGWWDEIKFCIWGPSQKLLASDPELQETIKKMQAAGVEVFACKFCADKYGVTEKIEAMGIPVFYVGQTVTEALKAGWATMTF